MEKFTSIAAIIGLFIGLPAIIYITEIYFFAGPNILSAIFTW